MKAMRSSLSGLFCTALAAWSLAAFTAPAVRAADANGDTNPATLTEADADQFFHLGEAYMVNDTATYFESYADQLGKRFDDYKSQATKAGAPKTVRDEIDRYRKIIMTLPWSKPWADWTDEQKDGWKNCNQNYSVWKKWFADVGNDQLFFYWLGDNSMDNWYNIEKSVTDNKRTVAEEAARVKVTLGSFATMMNDDGYTHARSILNPDALKILKQMVAYSSKLEDPLAGEGGVTAEMITQIGTAGKKLRDMARAGQLLTQ